MEPDAVAHRRQIIYWRLLTAVVGFGEQGAGFEHMALELTRELDLPELLLDPRIAIDTLLQRYPELEADFHQVQQQPKGNNAPGGDEAPPAAGVKTDSLRHALIFSKLLLNVLGPNTQTTIVTAQQYAQWLQDVGHLERACGFVPGGLRGKGQHDGTAGAGQGSSSETFVSEEQLRAALKEMEGDLIKRMALREILQNNQLAANLTPSMPLVEQLLRDKADRKSVV